MIRRSTPRPQPLFPIKSLVSTAFLTAPGFAQQQGPPEAPPDSVRQAAAAQFQQEHGSAWQIQWSPRTGVPAALLGGTAKGYGGPPEAAGRVFLQDHKKLFGIENARQGLAVARKNASKGNTRVLYRQVYEGVPVLNSGYLVAINQAGAVYYVSGDYYPDLQVSSTQPSLQSQDVVSRMRADLGGGAGFKVVQEPVLSIYVGEAGDRLTYHLAYEAKAERRSPLEAYKYIIDAQSGEVLFKTSLIEDIGEHGPAPIGRAAATGRDGAAIERNTPAGSAMVNGSGEVYKTNPLHESSPSEVTLHRLRDRSPRELYGYDVDINDRYGDDATSSSGTFDYSPSSHYFDQVMVYYHSDEFMAWLVGSIGWSDNIGEVDAETRSTLCYACTYPSQRNAFYSDGSSSAFRNPTREASVMAHEQMHIVSEPYHDLNTGFWGDALDEGYSDYFAVAYRHDRQNGQSTEVGEYALVGVNRQLDNGFSDPYANNDNYGGTDYYDASLVFTGALWDFTTDVAANVQEAATITLGSLPYLDADPSFLDARNALITAAGDAGHSGYECGIKEAFAMHGIGSKCVPPSPSLSVSLSGPTSLEQGEYGTWTADVSDGAPSFTYTWYWKPLYGSWQQVRQVTRSSRQDYYNRSMAQSTFDVKVEVSDSQGQTDSDFITVVYDTGGGDCPPWQICEWLRAGAPLPEEFALEGNYPNPFGGQTQIRFALPEAVQVTLEVYDVMGRKVATVVDQPMKAGFHEVPFEAQGLPSGVYLYRFRAGEQFADTGRMVVVR